MEEGWKVNWWAFRSIVEARSGELKRLDDLSAFWPSGYGRMRDILKSSYVDNASKDINRVIRAS